MKTANTIAGIILFCLTFSAVFFAPTGCSKHEAPTSAYVGVVVKTGASTIYADVTQRGYAWVEYHTNYRTDRFILTSGHYRKTEDSSVWVPGRLEFNGQYQTQFVTERPKWVPMK